MELDSIRAALALVNAVREEKEAYQQSRHPEQQHVHKVCGAKLEGDLFQLAAILNAARKAMDESQQFHTSLTWK